MSKYNLIIISTCCDHNYIYKLIKSVNDNNSFISVCVIIVNQTKELISGIKKSGFNNFKVIDHGENVNSSVARNIGIKYLLDNNYYSEFVCFPDDDSSYDDSFFKAIQKKIQEEDFKNLITDVYCTGTYRYFRKINLNNITLLSKKDFNIVGAVNMVLNYSTFFNVKYFDESFGINAKYGAGEDGDYFIRAVKFEPFYYSNEVYSFHPSSFDKFKKLNYKQKRKKLNTYGIGVMALLSKHKMYFHALYVVFRALGGAIFSFSRLELSLGLAYFEAFFVRLKTLVKFLIVPIK